MLVIVAVILPFALAAKQSAMAVLSCLIIAMIVGAKAWSRISLSKISHAARIDRVRLFPDEVVTLTVAVSNAKLLPVWLRVRVPPTAALSLGPCSPPLHRDTGISAYQQVSFDWQLHALRRGVHELGPVELETSDPLGFYPQREDGSSFRVVVFPRIVPVRAIALPRRDFYGRTSGASPVEDPTYIRGLREYQPGRAARHIHWKASARHDRLMESVCEPTSQPSVILVVQADRFAEDSSGESLESCLEVVASLALHFERSRFSVGLITNARLTGGGNAITSVSRDPGQLSRILDTLARVEPAPACDMMDLLHARPNWLPTSTALCFSYRTNQCSHEMQAFMRLRRIPSLTVACETDHSSVPFDPLEYRLTELRVEAAGTATAGTQLR
jgi:uncharacterized protein (DUF58 family)